MLLKVAVFFLNNFISNVCEGSDFSIIVAVIVFTCSLLLFIWGSLKV